MCGRFVLGVLGMPAEQRSAGRFEDSVFALFHMRGSKGGLFLRTAEADGASDAS